MSEHESPAVLSGLSPAEMKSLREAALNDLYIFARVVIGLDFLFAPLHGQLTAFLQQCHKRSTVVLPRGFLKTSICSKAYPIWRACRNPEIRILIVSNNEPNAKKMLSQIKQVFERNSCFQQLFPELIPDFAHTRWSDLAAEVNRSATIGYQEATFEAAGVRSNVVSRHYDLIIEDDTLSPQKDDVSGEELMPMREEVDQVIGWHKLATSLLITPAQSEILVVGTRWAYHDLLGAIAKEEPDYKHFSIAAETPDGEATYPSRFPTETLRQIEAAQGTYIYNALYMNRPVSSEKQIFKVEWLKEFDLAPANLRKFLAIDLAISQDSGADYNALVVGGVTPHGHLYILDVARLRGSPRDVLEAIFAFLDEHPTIERIALEAISYQQAFQYALRDGMIERSIYVPVEAITSRKTTKEQRILRLQPLAQAGRLHLRPDARALRNELLEFPYGRYDDLIDATSDLVPYVSSPDGPLTPEELPLEAQDAFSFDTIWQTLQKTHTSSALPFDVQLELGLHTPDDTTWVYPTGLN